MSADTHQKSYRLRKRPLRAERFIPKIANSSDLPDIAPTRPAGRFRAGVVRSFHHTSLLATKYH
jgi:hypothetical protein